MRTADCRGFTLLEAVVALVVAALLVMFLLPIVSHRKSPSRRAQCASNLSQIGKACAMYADVTSNLGHYPDDGASAMGSLNIIYGGYIKDSRVFSCDKTTVRTTGLADATKPAYVSNMVFGDQPEASCSYAYDRRHDPTHAVAGLAGEMMGGSDEPGPQGNSTAHGTENGHGLGQNFLACDGHVEWLDSTEREVNGATEHIFRDDTPGDDGIPLDSDTWLRGD